MEAVEVDTFDRGEETSTKTTDKDGLDVATGGVEETSFTTNIKADLIDEKKEDHALKLFALRNEVKNAAKNEFLKVYDLYDYVNPELIDYHKFNAKSTPAGGVEYYFIRSDGKEVMLNNKNNLSEFLSESTIISRISKTELRGIGLAVSSRTNDFIREKTGLKELYKTPTNIKEEDAIEMNELNKGKIESVDSLINSSSNPEEIKMLSEECKKLEKRGFTAREIQGFAKEMEKIRGHLKQAVSRDVELENEINREKEKLEDVRKNGQSSTQMTEEALTEKIAKLEKKRAVNKAHLNDSKMQMKDQAASIKESISKLMDGDIALSERIKNLFREKGVTIFSILTAVGMSIGVLVEALLPSTVTVAGGGSWGGSDTKEWLKKKLEVLKNLLKKLADKFGAALPGILDSIFSWVFNTLSKVVGAVAQNLWLLFVAAGILIYEVYRNSTNT